MSDEFDKDESSEFNHNPLVNPGGESETEKKQEAIWDRLAKGEDEVPIWERLSKENKQQGKDNPEASAGTQDHEGEEYFEYGGSELIARAPILDSEWAKHAFTDMREPSLYTKAQEGTKKFKNIKAERNPYYRTSADYKFEDSSLGGAIGVGSKPQYCRYSDVRVHGLSVREPVTIQPLKAGSAGFGMGRYYSEQIDDQQQLLYLRFGIVEFNSIEYFMSTFIKSDLRSLFSHGQANSYAYKAGKILGTSVLLYAHPLAAALALFATDVAKAAISRRTKFYSIKPTMHIYWSIVYTLINKMMANLHFDRALGTGTLVKRTQTMNEKLDGIGDLKDQGDDVLAMMGVRLHNGSIDIIGTVNRTIMQYNSYLSIIGDIDSNLQKNKDKMTDVESDRTIAKRFSKVMAIFQNQSNREFLPSMQNIATEIYKSKVYSINQAPQADGKYDKEAAKASLPPKLYTHAFDKEVGADGQPIGAIIRNDVTRIARAEMMQGSSFAIFKVVANKEYTETFTNSTKQSAVRSSMNSIASTSRTVQSTGGGGNVGTSVVAKSIEGGINLVTGFLGGTLDGVSMDLASGIKGVLSGIEVDIPDEWDTSEVGLPDVSYSMELTCLYNNPISLMTGIYIPISMLLAGTLPMQAGPRSNTSPLLCESYVRGGVYKTLGIIKSLNLVRGGGNMGFDTHGVSLTVKLTVSIADLTRVVAAPIVSNNSYLLPGYDLGADSSIDEYLSVLTGVSIYEQVFPMPALERRLNASIANLSSFYTLNTIGSALGRNNVLGKIMKFTKFSSPVFIN